MGLFQDLKLYARSGSLEFVLAKHASLDHSTSGEKKFKWRNHEIFYRPATSDQGAIYEILLRPPQKTEYFVDSRVRPQVILDIGANIGITTIWLKEQFANATIYAFEPMPENFRLLQKNTAKLANVHVFPFGLGSADMRADVYANEDRKNHGAFSIYARETDSENLGNTDKLADQIEIRNAGETLKRLDISQIDILKIDTEGAEFDIVSCLPENILKNCQWIMGELHGIRTYGVLNLLEPWFATQFKKTFTNELFTFFAMNRSLLKVNKPSISRSY
jgi:FkbM family methyltransferase